LQAGHLAQAALTEEPTAEKAVRRLLLGVVNLFADPAKPKGCLVVLGATNCAAGSEDMFEALAERRQAAEAAVRARIAAGAEAGELAEDADAGALADLVTGTLYGLAVKAKDGASKRRLRASVDQLMRMWPRAPGADHRPGAGVRGDHHRDATSPVGGGDVSQPPPSAL
jgi:AcrR family transcriptional regulator